MIERMKVFRSWWLACALMLGSGSATADDFNRVVTHVTTQSPEQILTILTSYPQICGSGCKYRVPNVKQILQLSHKKTDKSWYTWTWLSTALKDTKYFTHVTRMEKADGTSLLVLRLLSQGDDALIAELTKASGKVSQPAFDSGKTVFVLRKQGDGKTKFVQDVSLKASGWVGLFSDKIREGIEAGTRANIENIERAARAQK